MPELDDLPGSSLPVSDLPVSDLTRHRRLREKGSTSRADLDAVLAAGFVCHLAFVADEVPRALPTAYGYDAAAGVVYLHGSVASRSLVDAPAQKVCVTVTHVDGLSLARSVFEHGVGYRCAMVFGVPRVAEGEEKLHGLRVISEQAAPGQWDYARQPSRKELAATTVLALPVDEASVKTSDSVPDDGDGDDADLPVWAGSLPLRHVWGSPVPDPLLRPGLEVPAHVAVREGTPADLPAHGGAGG